MLTANSYAGLVNSSTANILYVPLLMFAWAVVVILGNSNAVTVLNWVSLLMSAVIVFFLTVI